MNNTYADDDSDFFTFRVSSLLLIRSMRMILLDKDEG